MDSIEVLPSTPPNITLAASEASSSLLPQKSLGIYENTLEKFMQWRNTNNVQSFSERVILAYLSELSTKVKSSTLWSHYSMLKSTLSVKYNVQIGDYPKVRAFLKRKNEGYIPKKSRVLEKEHVLKFLKEAPDEKYLLTKLFLLFVVAEALRRDELYKLKMDDIQNLGTVLIVSVNDTKTKVSRKFTVTEYLDIYHKYVALRPKDYAENKFFINYQRGKCTRQVIGINKIGKVPSEVATFLKLPNPNEFTGHSLRRSSASLLVEGGGDLLTLKKHGGWKSSSVAEAYVEESLTKKIDVCNKILTTENNRSYVVNTNSTSSTNFVEKEKVNVHFDNLQNCNITVHNNYYCNKEN